MVLEYFLYFSVILCWGLNIFFLARFALDWHKNEPSKPGAWAAMAAVAALAVGISFFLPARGGYDNNHDFMCLGIKFFTDRPRALLSFKEVSPLFTDAVSDLLSANSLSAILYKNRLLQGLSIFVFFTGLRRLGAGLAVAAASAAFLFLNFLSPLNASSFSTTSSNLLIWLISLAAIFDAFASPGPGAAGAAWIMSSLVLLISARVEFVPANLLLLAALAAAKASRNRFFFKPGNLAAIAAGAIPAAVWGFHALNPSPARQIIGETFPLLNLLYQLGTKNLGVAAGLPPHFHSLYMMAGHSITTAAAALCGGFFLLVLCGIAAGCLADRKNIAPRLAALALLSLWIGYFSAIFQPLDLYPLHFMRHQLYFFVPFAFLFALGLEGFERAAGAAGRRVFPALCLLALGGYAALNAKAALGFNRELRTNDRELDFLMKAQREWPAQARVAHPVRNRGNTRADMIRKYFPAMRGCPPGPAEPLLKYVSPEPLIFSDSEAGPLDQAPLAAGPPGSAWKALSFDHAFYTVFTGRGTETRAPVPLTIGFFTLDETGPDRAFLETTAGVCDLTSGKAREAAEKFGRAVAAAPACLNCRYFLSLSYAVAGKKAEALSELMRIEKAGAKVPAEHRALIESLARGETGQAAELAREISDKNPEFFFRQNLYKFIKDGTGTTHGSRACE